jgi:serine/threonine protein kinase
MLNRDIKLDNILVGNDFQIKICDLGLSKSIEEEHDVIVGSPGFMAPEVLEG